MRCASLAIVRDSEGKVLLLYRSEGSPLGWGFPGGRCFAGEDAQRAAERELFEETGMRRRAYAPTRTRWNSNGDTPIVAWKTEDLTGVNSTEVKLSSEHTAFSWFGPENYKYADLQGYATRSLLHEIFHGTPAPYWPLRGVKPMLPDAPGCFGAHRKHDRHVGVDLYCNDGTPVVAMLPGQVTEVVAFTGPNAVDPSPWWEDTKAAIVQSEDGTRIVYGEITPRVRVGQMIDQGQLIGHVKTVLTKDKGRPMSMLHLEQLTPDGQEGEGLAWWPLDGPKPERALDPTPLLRWAAMGEIEIFRT